MSRSRRRLILSIIRQAYIRYQRLLAHWKMKRKHGRESPISGVARPEKLRLEKLVMRARQLEEKPPLFKRCRGRDGMIRNTPFETEREGILTLRKCEAERPKHHGL